MGTAPEVASGLTLALFTVPAPVPAHSATLRVIPEP